MSIIIYNYASNPTQLQNTKSASVTQTTLLLGDGLEHRLLFGLSWEAISKFSSAKRK